MVDETGIFRSLVNEGTLMARTGFDDNLLPRAQVKKAAVKTRYWVPVLVLLMLFVCSAPGLALQVHREAVVKSAILFNLTRFVEWPTYVFADAESPFRVAVVGENLLQNELFKWVNNDYAGRRIEVDSYSDLEKLRGRIGDYQFIYLAEDKSDLASELIALIGNHPVLTASDSAGFFRQGGVISLTEVDGKTRFSLNIDAATRCQLSISSKVAKLSDAVIKDGKLIGGGP